MTRAELIEEVIAVLALLAFAGWAMFVVLALETP